MLQGSDLIGRLPRSLGHERFKGAFCENMSPVLVSSSPE